MPLFGAAKTAERVLLRGRVGTRGGAVLYPGLSMNCDAVLRDGLTIADTLDTLLWYDKLYNKIFYIFVGVHNVTISCIMARNLSYISPARIHGNGHPTRQCLYVQAKQFLAIYKILWKNWSDIMGGLVNICICIPSPIITKTHPRTRGSKIPARTSNDRSSGIFGKV